jgi:two-component system sensor histidine kinase UhpB
MDNLNKLKILYLEDSQQDAEIVGRILKKAGLIFEFKLVDSQEEYNNALQDYAPDIVLADHSLFQFNSAEALRIFREKEMKIPFILVTGTVSEEFAVNILKQGADDYLLKNNLVRLPSAIINSLEKYRLEKERQEYFDHVIANEALMKEAERLALFGSWEANVLTGEIKWSDGMYHILGYQPGQIKPGHDIILYRLHPDDRASYQDAIYSYLVNHDLYTSDLRIIGPDQKQKFVSSKIVVFRNHQRQLTRFLGFFQDVTQKIQLEKELAAHAQNQQKLITEVTMQAQEKERNQIGRELHDNINQVLATVKMFLDVGLHSAEKREELLPRSIHNINYAIEEIRKLSRALVTPSLGDMGLTEALNELAEEVSVSGNLKIEVSVQLNDQEMGKNLELTLYRIAQEQLNNICKYAKATRVLINLVANAKGITFSITDDGQGFDPSVKARGIGLKNMNNRVAFYSGQMNIISTPGEGCTLAIVIPPNAEDNTLAET